MLFTLTIGNGLELTWCSRIALPTSVPICSQLGYLTTPRVDYGTQYYTTTRSFNTTVQPWEYTIHSNYWHRVRTNLVLQDGSPYFAANFGRTRLSYSGQKAPGLPLVLIRIRPGSNRSMALTLTIGTGLVVEDGSFYFGANSIATRSSGSSHMATSERVRIRLQYDLTAMGVYHIL